MELAPRQDLVKIGSLVVIKSFLIWSFTLTVCLLVVGFPLIVVMATVGAILSVALQVVLPISGALLVGGSLIGFNVLAILVGAAVLTSKGIHPQDVSWLHWLHGESTSFATPTFAACPLTCSIQR